MSSSDPKLTGNRLVLAGVVLYFMEWLVIAVAPSLPTDELGHEPAAIAAAYAEHPGRTAFLAGWLSVVLLGRIVFCIGVRSALRESGRPSMLADVAVAAMAVSVTTEVIDYALVASGGWLAHAHGSASAIVALDTAGTMVFQMVFAPIGFAIVAAAAAMLASGPFRRWLCGLGLVGGSLLVAGGVVGAAARGSGGTLHGVGSALTGTPVALCWVWLLATGVVLFRAAPRRMVRAAAAPARA
jgi:hypothetical protein